MIQELIKFASRHDPDFSRKIRGATEEEIEAFEQLARRKLPSLYREFLEYMGRDMGDVGIHTINFNMDAVAAYHKNGQEYDWPERYLMIAEHEQDPYCHFFLDLKTLDNGDCRVVSFDSMLSADELQDRFITLQADSFRGLLFRTAFLCQYLGRFPYQHATVLAYPKLMNRSATPDETLDTFEGAARKLGFDRVARVMERLTHASVTNLMLDRQDACIFAKCGAPGKVPVTLTGRDEREVLRLREILIDHAAAN